MPRQVVDNKAQLEDWRAAIARARRARPGRPRADRAVGHIHLRRSRRAARRRGQPDRRGDRPGPVGRRHRPAAQHPDRPDPPPVVGGAQGPHRRRLRKRPVHGSRRRAPWSARRGHEPRRPHRPGSHHAGGDDVRERGRRALCARHHVLPPRATRAGRALPAARVHRRRRPRDPRRSRRWRWSRRPSGASCAATRSATTRCTSATDSSGPCATRPRSCAVRCDQTGARHDRPARPRRAPRVDPRRAVAARGGRAAGAHVHRVRGLVPRQGAGLGIASIRTRRTRSPRTCC